VDKVTQGGQTPAYSVTPPVFKHYEPPDTSADDPQLAQELLAQAGYCLPPTARSHNGNKRCKAMPPISILFNTREIHRQIAQAIHQMWRETLGISDIKLVNQEWKVFLHATRSKQYDISFGSWLADYPDPNAFLEIWTSDNANNRTGWRSETYDTLIEKAGQTQGRDDRYKILRRAEQLLLEQMPVIPIYVYASNYLIKPYVRGIEPNPMSIHPSARRPRSLSVAAGARWMPPLASPANIILCSLPGRLCIHHSLSSFA
jgi:oligopeptide transport system substrate-binding protein